MYTLCVQFFCSVISEVHATLGASCHDQRIPSKSIARLPSSSNQRFGFEEMLDRVAHAELDNMVQVRLGQD